MRINVYGVYRDVVGAKTLELESEPGSTVRQLLAALVRRCPPLRPELFDEQGELYTHVPVFLNGRNPRLLPGGLETILAPADVLNVFSPIASGRLNVEAIKQVSAAGPEEH